MDADGLANGADRRAGNHAGARAAGISLTSTRRNGPARCAGSRCPAGRWDHLPRAVLDGLFHGGRHFIGLAVSPAHLAAAVADHDQGCETEAAASLDHGGATPDLDHLVDQLTACRRFCLGGISAVLFCSWRLVELMRGIRSKLRPASRRPRPGRPRGRGTCSRGGRTRPPAHPLPRPAGPMPCHGHGGRLVAAVTEFLRSA